MDPLMIFKMNPADYLAPKETAKELIASFYYVLPNNGFINEGINSCNSRWKEAKACAQIAVDRILKELNDNCNTAGCIGRKKHYEETKEQIEKL